jgi:SAM-dependent methyltransferase
MGRIYTTEVTSDTLVSDNPLHQRLLKAYVAAVPFVSGNVLEVGCGQGRGVHLLVEKAAQFTAVDKLEEPLVVLREKFPQARFMAINLPPFTGLADDAYDCVVSFQVIEHIEDDTFFLKEIHRVLKSGGVALLTTPNRKMTLTRNPWHVREYVADELEMLARRFFPHVEVKGIAGNDKVMAYYEQNKKAVQRLLRWDVLNLQHRLPAWMLRLPYEWLNRLNRNRLQSKDDALVRSITHDDYFITGSTDQALDLLLVAKK